jgi:hypothetical protein
VPCEAKPILKVPSPFAVVHQYSYPPISGTGDGSEIFAVKM